jgi:VanZ family protein
MFVRKEEVAADNDNVVSMVARRSVSANCGGTAAVLRHLLGITCIAVLSVIFSLGLWPFHVPDNEVEWLTDRNGLHFGRFATVFSSGALPPPTEDRASSSIEIWLEPSRIWDFGTFLSFWTPDDVFRFSLCQWQTGLLLKGTQALRIDNVFPRTGPAFLTFTTGPRGTVLYVDGVVVKRALEYKLSSSALTGRLVLGDSAGQSDSWKGRLLGLALYSRELSGDQVVGHYLTWTRQKRLRRVEGQGIVALYLFDEHQGRVVHNNAGAGAELQIPQKYTVLDQLFLETPWSEFRRTSGFWAAVAKNIVGFVPLGVSFYAYLSLVRLSRTAVFATIGLGFAVSLTIEVLQAFLPTRASGMTDLITNTIGNVVGIVVCEAAIRQPRLRAYLDAASLSPIR